MPKVALYLRLSVDETDTDESNSIINQRYLLHHFLDNSSEFQSFQREEFVDDGFSGTSVNRPAFQRLMGKVKSGEIRHIIVKDLSRFMRDYLELGNYLENIFPFLGVRFIALNDQYDSLTSESNGVEIDVPFKNLLNDFYAKDVSEKVKSAMNSMKRSGKNMSWLPPFGYLKDPDDRFKIIIDDEVAPIVRRIFKLCIEGVGGQRIASLLNEEQTITPAERKMQVSNARYKNSIILTKEQHRNVWTKGTVRQILKNEAYKGTYLFNARTYIRGKHIVRPQSEWECIEDHHEAIVSPEDFELAKQSRASRARRPSQKTSPNLPEAPLQGIIYCEHCGHRLSLLHKGQQSEGVHCSYCKAQGHRMPYVSSRKIEQVILATLSGQTVQDSPSVSKNDLLRELEQLKRDKVAYFHSYKEGHMSREDYLLKKETLDQKKMDLEAQLSAEVTTHSLANHGLTKEVVVTHIEKILINRFGNINVLYKGQQGEA